MKFSLALIATLFTSAAAIEISEVKADSKFGMDLLSKSRRAEENDGDDEVDTTWISGYALKFQGCHHISQWNAEADGDEDVRIETKRLARFRLCPVDSCSKNSGAGCSGKYGDYIVDMDTFLATYMENKEEAQEEACEDYGQNTCDCYYSDDEEGCMQTCYANAGMTECYDQDEGEYYGQAKQIEVADYLECTQYGGGRRLDENDGDGDGDAAYYVGPYCSDQGGKIVLGMFTDDTCTEFADDYGGRSTFESMTGTSLPYSSTSIVDSDCYSCAGETEKNDNGYYETETKEACGDLYDVAGKCESYLSGEVSDVNESACTYMQGIKITRKNGIIISGMATKNKVASVFIGMFSVSFVLLGSYVYYLKTKLDRGAVNLSD
mmetsp:Transcript_14429/g.21637  ORF Transcript_14429/g.21637 Transcript_14429/m.21637 type:complete len:379 (+) Transcript_14429:326-1462(+)